MTREEKIAALGNSRYRAFLICNPNEPIPGEPDWRSHGNFMAWLVNQIAAFKEKHGEGFHPHHISGDEETQAFEKFLSDLTKEA